MTTAIKTGRQVSTEGRQLAEMAWDPITRIVGSLGIYTKIDFANRQIAECYSTSSIFRGYSEALLVNRLSSPPAYYRVGIDKCYELVGLIHSHWRGLSGGKAVLWELDRFFTGLKERAHAAGDRPHA
jgi:hypothetical protein